MAPKPPSARRAPAKPWRASITVVDDGAPKWPPGSLDLAPDSLEPRPEEREHRDGHHGRRAPAEDVQPEAVDAGAHDRAVVADQHDQQHQRRRQEPVDDGREE